MRELSVTRLPSALERAIGHCPMLVYPWIENQSHHILCFPSIKLDNDNNSVTIFIITAFIAFQNDNYVQQPRSNSCKTINGRKYLTKDATKRQCDSANHQDVVWTFFAGVWQNVYHVKSHQGQRTEPVHVDCWNLIKQRQDKWCEAPSFCCPLQSHRAAFCWGHAVRRAQTFHCRYYLRGRTAGGERLVPGFIWIHQKAGGGFGGKRRRRNQPLCLGPSRGPIVSTFICSCTAERVLYCCGRGGAIHLHWLSYGRASLWISEEASAWKCQWNSVWPSDFQGVPAAAPAPLHQNTPFPDWLFKFSLGRHIFSVSTKSYSSNTKIHTNKVCEMLPIQPLSFSLIDFSQPEKSNCFKLLWKCAPKHMRSGETSPLWCHEGPC